MATAGKTNRTFSVTCPHCKDADATVTLDLNDLSKCECSGCSETFTPQQAASLFQAEADRWAKVARWVELAATL